MESSRLFQFSRLFDSENRVFVLFKFKGRIVYVSVSWIPTNRVDVISTTQYLSISIFVRSGHS